MILSVVHPLAVPVTSHQPITSILLLFLLLIMKATAIPFLLIFIVNHRGHPSNNVRVIRSIYEIATIIQVIVIFMII